MGTEQGVGVALRWGGLQLWGVSSGTEDWEAHDRAPTFRPSVWVGEGVRNLCCSLPRDLCFGGLLGLVC